MEFGPAAVRHVLAMFEPGPVPAEEAARLSALVGSWEEMLAHLLLRRGTLAAYPELDAAIRARAESYRGGPATRRPPGGDMRRLAETEEALEEALAALLAAERERRELADRALEAWRAHVAERPAGRCDVRLRIGVGVG
jgi:hypothetical protein